MADSFQPKSLDTDLADLILITTPKPSALRAAILTIAGGSAAAATTSTNGTVKKMPAQADSTASTVAAVVVDFNALLAKLRTAGILS